MERCHSRKTLIGISMSTNLMDVIFSYLVSEEDTGIFVDHLPVFKREQFLTRHGASGGGTDRNLLHGGITLCPCSGKVGGLLGW